MHTDANATRDPSDGLGNQRWYTYIIPTIYHTNYCVYNVTHQNSQTNLFHCIHHHCHPTAIGNVSDNPYYAVTISLDAFVCVVTEIRFSKTPLFEIPSESPWPVIVSICCIVKNVCSILTHFYVYFILRLFMIFEPTLLL